ncbi:hypothetical protein [Sphingomonas jatrophae]|nr:hypothetical protein [Sphingomonas jatrophae]
MILLAAAAALLGGCARNGDFDETGGIRLTRSACPAVAIPAFTGDVTSFDPPQSREARAIDVVATITNLRNTCNSATDPMTVTATFEVQARRAAAGPAREVVLPYFATVMRGGTQIVSKQVGRIAVRFADGQLRASAPGQASATVSLAAATLPADVQATLSRKRKAGDEDAAVDPMTDPAVRAAVQKASFELLVGFQLTQDQLAYNATR